MYCTGTYLSCCTYLFRQWRVADLRGHGIFSGFALFPYPPLPSLRLEFPILRFSVRMVCSLLIVVLPLKNLR
ncbi:hypothetical protein BDV28DRAFT_126793 [Aspergillus coremiiformis]|uniref:Uncharacterized protein n=1 Tax=Aspergillus coremiiformis TaxID=138285 RepID=A0A5N6ZGB1_9EURO|nr:hypothetical protein BDV28DRAFT_126793 [Aspergillus coremiiformis]